MDEKHRQYCIKLGNPYMQEQRYQEQLKPNGADSLWMKEEPFENKQDWFKNKKNHF